MQSAKYMTSDLNYSELDRITIPKFQRGFVWNKTKKKDFIETLHNGFPFGSLLVYPESMEPGAKLQLLDGQQRLSTIREYAKDNLKFWKQINQEQFDSKLKELNGQLSDTTQIDEQKFSQLIRDEEFYENWLDDLLDTETRKKSRTIIKEIRGLITEYLDLNKLKLPVITFTGDKSQIAEVFANLNKGGIPLTKYEIFGAAWVNTEIELPRESIASELLELLFKYYVDKNEETQFDFMGPTYDELLEQRNVTLSELCIALGYYVQEKLPALVGQGSSNAHAEIGFGLLAMSQNVDNRKLDTLNNHVENIDREIIDILEKVERICRDLQQIFGKLLSNHSYKSSNEYELGLSTTFKTLSYFAALWKLSEGSSDYRKTLKNIKVYFVSDYLRGVWGSHGDQRLAEYYPQMSRRNYLEPISVEKLQEEFDRWLEDVQPGIRFSSDVRALVAIHANLTYMSGYVSQGDPFELEHIIAKKRIDLSEKSSHRQILGSSIGNCMYLPKSKNNSKKDKTLYESPVKDANGNPVDMEKFILESDYFSEEQFIFINDALVRHDYDVVNDNIRHRATLVCHKIAHALITSDL